MPPNAPETGMNLGPSLSGPSEVIAGLRLSTTASVRGRLARNATSSNGG